MSKEGMGVREVVDRPRVYSERVRRMVHRIKYFASAVEPDQSELP
jgi:hypothetical protein